MKGLCLQMKSVLRDKFCLMTFFLPIVVAAAFQFAGTVDFSAMGELHFGVLENDLSGQTLAWLEQYGAVTVYGTREELIDGINEPSTNIIGVEAACAGIKTMVSGDELEHFRQAADTLPALYGNRGSVSRAEVTVRKKPDLAAGFREMIIAAILITAMFMGGTFNAMNVISEKEDGVVFVNEILPMTHGQYLVQKIAVGFLYGCLSSILTAAICCRMPLWEIPLLIILVALSAFVAAVVGLLIGRISEGMLVSVAYLKIVLILFMGVPILCFLSDGGGILVRAICYLVPSQPAFEGIMGLLEGEVGVTLKDIGILAMHGGGWFLVSCVITH